MMRCFHLLQAIALFLLLTTVSAGAQSEQVDFDIWEQVAQRAETAVESDGVSTDGLEDLRSVVSGFRDRLLQQQNAGDPRLATLQSQLDAIGDVPENGDEPQELAERRAELESQIAEIQAPIRRSEEAYNRADGLIKEIDDIIRSRQTDALLTRGPEPLDPRLWPSALTDLVSPVKTISAEIQSNWSNEVRRKEFYDDLPAILFSVILAILLLFRAPAFVDRFGEWLRAKTRRGSGVWTTLSYLAQLALPVMGVSLLVQAGDVSGLFGRLGEHVLYLLPWLLLVVLLARWLAEESFPRAEGVKSVTLSSQRRSMARYLVNFLACLLAVHLLFESLFEFGEWSLDTFAVLSLPVHLICGVLLFRIGRILRLSGQQEQASDETEIQPLSFTSRLARLAGQGAMLVGVMGPILSAIGYLNVAQALIFSTTWSLGLFALMLALQRLVHDLIYLVKGTKADDSDSLLLVFSGVILTIIPLPVFALIWGARVADLTELWTRFQAGFSIGDTKISPSDFLTVAVIFTIGLLLTRLLQGGLRGSVLPKTKIDQGGQTAIVSGAGYLGIFLSAIVAITGAGIDLTALAVVAGALSIGIGFGLQNIVQNFVSGIILLIERPISEGDWIEVNGQHGTVRDISVRSTRIETFDRTDVIVPNADLVSNSVTNYTRGNVIGRLIVNVGVAYGTDTRKVEDILYKIARNHDMVLMNPAPFVHFIGFGADSLDFDVRMILRDVTKTLVVRTEVNHQINEAFAKEGIEIPFAQRDVWLRNPEALSGAPEPASGKDGKDPLE